MEKRLLHITNGDGLTEKLQQLKIPGEVIIWREMLCEGPTVQDIGDKEFNALRQDFFRDSYNIPESDYRAKFLEELEKLREIKELDEVVLWFEFDLFSHINMMGVISFLNQNNKDFPLFLVCSGKVEGEQKLLPLPELSTNQLQDHYDHKLQLNEDDTGMAMLIWDLYCGSNPSRLISEIKKTTNFRYLPSCLRAHIERFPNVKTGLNSLETNLLKLIGSHDITSHNQLLGYALEYQGYYGYEAKQMQRVINKLSEFYTESPERIRLSPEGEMAITSKKNFYQDLQDDEFYGGVRKYDYLYDPQTHNLHKL